MALMIDQAGHSFDSFVHLRAAPFAILIVHDETCSNQSFAYVGNGLVTKRLILCGLLVLILEAFTCQQLDAVWIPGTSVTIS